MKKKVINHIFTLFNLYHYKANHKMIFVSKGETFITRSYIVTMVTLQEGVKCILGSFYFQV